MRLTQADLSNYILPALLFGHRDHRRPEAETFKVLQDLSLQVPPVDLQTPDVVLVLQTHSLSARGYTAHDKAIDSKLTPSEAS